MKALRNMLVGLALAGLAACALMESTPEQQVVTGANSVESGANLVTTLRARERITDVQARQFQALIYTADGALEAFNSELVACRVRTNSTQKSSPDPCKGDYISDIALTTAILGQIEANLKEKE